MNSSKIMGTKQPSFKIQIPEPCPQSWDEMTPENGGRHCISCAKTVVDFTRMTDTQIQEALRAPSISCGRFRDDQLNRKLIPPPAKKRYSFAGFYKVAASLLLVQAVGCVETHKDDVQIHSQDKTPQKPETAFTTVSGFVLDDAGKPVTGASVAVDSLSTGAITEMKNGAFKLRLADSLFQNDSLRVTVQRTGYDETHFTVSKNAGASDLKIVLTNEDSNHFNQILGGIRTF